MPDITMCEGGDCPKKMTCYLHVAIPTPRRQSWFVTPPYADGQCEHYIAATPAEIQLFLSKIMEHLDG